jgi:hypothetical protein
MTQALEFTFTLSGSACARAEVSRSRVFGELAEHLNGKTFAQWETAREEFKAGATSAAYADPQKLWERAVNYGVEMGLITARPKAEGAAAVKAAARTAAADKLAELAKATTPVKLRIEAAELAKAGTAEGIKAAADKLATADKLAKAAQSAADKAVREQLAKARETFEAALKAAKAEGLGLVAVYAELTGVVAKAVAAHKAATAAKPKAAKTKKAAEPATM